MPIATTNKPQLHQQTQTTTTNATQTQLSHAQVFKLDGSDFQEIALQLPPVVHALKHLRCEVINVPPGWTYKSIPHTHMEYLGHNRQQHIQRAIV